MSAPVSTTTKAALSTPAIPPRARALAARLDALFATDQQIIARLNGAHHRLTGANDRLRAATAVDRFAAGEQIHLAFCAYQRASEQRRQLAVDVGELSQQLTDVLTAAGHTREQAHTANVQRLAAGTWQPTQEQETQR